MSSRARSFPAERLECVINVSEGRHGALVETLAEAAGASLLDVHRDGDHNRSVFTLAGIGGEVEADARRLAAEAVTSLDLRTHHGAHPRLGVLDVVPWISLVADGRRRLRDGPIELAVAARDRFVEWAAAHLDLPCFVYGPRAADGPGREDSERTLPELRRDAWRRLGPDAGPSRPHPRAGAACVGARRLLVAYNLWLARPDLGAARRIAGEVRGPALRTLGLQVGESVQVSCNLIDPWTVGPAAAFDAVASRAEVARAELVGLLPLGVLDAIPSARWPRLDLDPARTIEARLEQAGLDGGRFG